MAKPFTIYKVTLLYMLDKFGFPLTNTQISNFFLEKDYTDYFRVQEVISTLTDSMLIHAESTYSNTQYSLTDAGKEALDQLMDKVNEEIENDIQNFYDQKKSEFQFKNSILADYYKAPNENYAVQCQIRNDGKPFISLTLMAKTKEQAETICMNWKKQYEDVYTFLMDTLIQ